ncbi:MAG: RNA polymerase sigma factor [Verrucomicrobia bacterium]|nr:RNA polymerase sigma factor [Verrucomicrobiota bacterium]MBU1733658.1 RNA polymerase sigma factor [Verrucomicrobiota bacterium]MBU1857677.1 RNA polymerase sigma factor [Verrucomicrobiota bacterium]
MEEELVNKAKNGDLKSFDALIERFKNMAFGYAYWFCDDFHMAEDIVQNAFIEAYRELHKLRNSAAFPGWFRRILLKNCDRLTRGRRVSMVSLETAAEISAPGLTPAEAAEKQDDAENIQQALYCLPEGERKVVSLYYISGLSQNEVAEFLGVPETTVNNRLHSARKRLTERMSKMIDKKLKEHALPSDFGKEFNPALAKALALCRNRFGKDLKAVYLTGSVASGEALMDASDLNWFMFLDRDPDASDISWCREQERSLKKQFPGIQSYVFFLFSVDRLQKEAFWRFILKYNSVRLYGENILAALEKEGLETPQPTRELARSRLEFVEECLESAVHGRLTPKLMVLPINPFWATRKLVRYFVIIEGAYVLMADGTFGTFHQQDVLSKLKQTCPQWRELLAQSEKILKNPIKANILPHVFVKQVAPFVRWAIKHVRGTAIQ